MKRSSFQPKPLKPAKPKLGTCKVCKQPYPKFGMSVACSVPCALEVARIKREKADRQVLKDARKNIAERRQKLKGINELKADAQKVFNTFVRYRDKDLPCICCGRTVAEHSLTGSVWDAGHYKSTGSADHLRYHENNCHRQLVKCNRFGAGRAVDYRIGLIKRIGLDAVEALECDQTIVKWTREMLIEIKKTYQDKLKAMKSQKKISPQSPK